MIFPAIMQIDYVRVYQRSDAINIGCDPKDYPTADYINSHLEAYSSKSHHSPNCHRAPRLTSHLQTPT